jgi:phosphoribosylformylglycinamidine cyclo-ligase
MAHITGGGLFGRLKKLTDLSFDINLSWDKIPHIFKLISSEGKIEFQEMIRVFNMGVGFVAVVDSIDVEAIVKDSDWFVVGTLNKGNGNISVS